MEVLFNLSFLKIDLGIFSITFPLRKINVSLEAGIISNLGDLESCGH